MEMILSCGAVTGDALQQLGIVCQALPAHYVVPAAISCAHNIASKSSPIVQLAKQAIISGQIDHLLETMTSDLSTAENRWQNSITDIY